MTLHQDERRCGVDAPAFLSDPGLKESPLVRALFPLTGKVITSDLMYRLMLKFEGGHFFSRSLRRLLFYRHGIIAEAYSYGAFHCPGFAEPGVRIGRYASVAYSARWGRNHPIGRPALSPFFYLPVLGAAEELQLPQDRLEIGADAWIGEMVVITSGCTRIGTGAIVGAGSVVTHDIPDFAIAVGSPARVKRFRFDDHVQEALRRSRWWELSPEALRPWIKDFRHAADDPRTLQALASIERRANAVHEAGSLV
jgi:virginiamycin A acetyltransferase